jgi:hypothetical protein
MISSSMRVGFMSLDSFGVGVDSGLGEEHEEIPISAVNPRTINRISESFIELSMSKDGPKNPSGQY